jgi:ubiquinone biosynthesis protein
METRTELILLQRTMVVVEGVARSLNPQMNIWQVAKPVVEDYIRSSLGPRAFATTLGKSAMVLSRFGPRLPQLLEAALMRASLAPPAAPPRRRRRDLALWGVGGAVMGAALTAAWTALM